MTRGNWYDEFFSLSLRCRTPHSGAKLIQAKNGRKLSAVC